MVSFPAAAKHHRHLASIKLYSFVSEAHGEREQLAGVAT